MVAPGSVLVHQPVFLNSLLLGFMEASLVIFAQVLTCVWLFLTPWTAACRAFLSFTISLSLLKLMSIKSVKWSEVTQSRPTHCDSMDCSLPDSSVHGIFQARILEWVAISFSRRSSRHRDWTQVSRIICRCFTVWATREVNSVKPGTCPPSTWISFLIFLRQLYHMDEVSGHHSSNLDSGAWVPGFESGITVKLCNFGQVVPPLHLSVSSSVQ